MIIFKTIFFIIFIFIIFVTLRIAFHVVKMVSRRNKDIRCEQLYGHDHDDESQTQRYIVHEEPEQGYVILNGVKRKISDCRDL